MNHCWSQLEGEEVGDGDTKIDSCNTAQQPLPHYSPSCVYQLHRGILGTGAYDLCLGGRANLDLQLQLVKFTLFAGCVRYSAATAIHPLDTFSLPPSQLALFPQTSSSAAVGATPA